MSRAQAHNTLQTSQGPVPYRVINRKRVTRRLHLDMDDNGGLLVVVPFGWPGFYTARLLRNNLTMIERFLSNARRKALPPLNYRSGESHWFKGQQLVLEVSETAQRGSRVEVQGGRLKLALKNADAQRVKAALQQWYAREARHWFEQRLGPLLDQAPWADPAHVSLALRRMKRTWGTCSLGQTIRLNTHLIKAPECCVDFVISHEICHLQEMNHSPAFYALQDQLWPQWRDHRQFLRRHGYQFLQT